MIKKRYSSSFSFKKTNVKKEEKPNLKLDFVGLIDPEKNLGQSVMYGKIDFPKNKSLKKGWYVIDPKEIANKTIKEDASLLYLGKAPLRGIKVYLADRYFKGIGEVLAETIVDDGDMDSLRVIRGESFKIKDRFKLKDEHAQSIQEG